MDALVCLQPGKLEVQERSAPVPEPGSLLVRPRRIGICGTDYHIFEGKHPFLEYPRVMGHELAVEVIEAPKHSAFSTGDICVVNPYLSCGTCIACRAGKSNCCVSISVLGVHQDGGMAELLTLPEKNLIRADGLSVDECAVVEFLAIGAHAVRRGAVAAGDDVLVVGAGPIGLGVALFARLAGADVTVLDLDAERLEAARTIAGASSMPVEGDLTDAVSAYTDGEGFGVVFDATGNRNAMQNGFAYVAHGGRYVLVSVVTDTITFSDPEFHRREMTLLGSRNATGEDFNHVIASIRAGLIPVDRIVTHRTTLDRAVEDLPRWATEKSGLIKALVEIG